MPTSHAEDSHVLRNALCPTALTIAFASSLWSAQLVTTPGDRAVPKPSAKIIQPASHVITPSPTSITAFVGSTASGPINAPVQVRSVAEFSGLFGNPVQSGALGVAVSDYFANGGKDAIVVRVSPLRSAEDLVGSAKRSAHQGLYALDSCGAFNLLCVPPYKSDGSVDKAVVAEAASYCESRCAILVVDPPASWSDYNGVVGHINDIGTTSANAAIYYPKIRRRDSATGVIADVAPSGAVAGVIAHNDLLRGVWKAPAGSAAQLTGVTDFSVSLSESQTGVLSAQGINCLRSFPGRGALVWGAKTVPGADLEWQYLNVRRLALHIRDSVSRGTVWAGSQTNAEPLWAELRTSVSEFMRGLWMKGALLGQKPEEAFFVRCGRDTMNQNDLDQGRVVILIGFAATRPAEFLTVRVAQTVRKR